MKNVGTQGHGAPRGEGLVFEHEWVSASVGPERGTEMPTEDGFYFVNVIKNPYGYVSGVVQVVTHSNNGKPWPWAYRVPKSAEHKTHGNPLRFWTGCEWRGPLTLLNGGSLSLLR